MRKLDFIVIGAARSGTTSLWAHLGSHPDVWMPGAKEAALFSHDERHARRVRWYMREYFADAPTRARLGTATPHYMRGQPGTPVEEIARRIQHAFPRVRLIAILRDPVERAISHWTYATRNGRESRALDVALAEQLEPAALEEARRAPEKTNGYLTFGEYGRILAAYRPLFGPEQLLLLRTADLEAAPAETMRRCFEHIGVEPGFRAPDLEARHHRVGRRRRISEEAERELWAHLEEEAWSSLRGRRRREAKRTFDFWFRRWNMLPDDAPAELQDGELRAALREHYADDAEALVRDWGFEVPWRTSIASARTSS